MTSSHAAIPVTAPVHAPCGGRLVHRSPGGPRLVIVPGLHGSGAGHWQTWLEGQFAGAVRVDQDDWAVPDIERWGDRVAEIVAALGPGPHVLAAHSFGCLATLRALLRHPDLAVSQLLLVAPAEPARFDVAHALPQTRLAVDSCVVASDTDPWMSATQARAWALRWGSDWVNLGDAGHINVDSGHGPFALARDWTFAALRRLAPQVDARGFDARPWRIAA
jgi:predicted alpha/beta hydrolase family esterase